MAANCDSAGLSVMIIFCTAHHITIQRLLWKYEAHIYLFWCHRQTHTDIFFYFTDYKLAL